MTFYPSTEEGGGGPSEDNFFGSHGVCLADSVLFLHNMPLGPESHPAIVSDLKWPGFK